MRASTFSASAASTPLWARPGVSWFRQMMFPAKAAIILFLLVLPMLVALSILITDRKMTWQSTASERAGLVVIQLVLQAMDANKALHKALEDVTEGGARSDLPELRANFEASFGQLHQQAKPRLDSFALRVDSHWRTAMAAYEAAAQARGPVTHATVAQQPHVEINAQLGELLKDTVNASGLALDPDGDSYYLMLACTVALPHLMDSLSQSRQALVRHLNTSGIDSLAEAASRAAVDRELVREVIEYLRQANGFNPDLQGQGFPERMASAKALIERHEALLRQDDLSGVRSADIVEQIRSTLQDLGALQRSVAGELDRLLAARQERLLRRTVFGSSLALALLAAGLYFFYCFYRVMNSGIRTLMQRMHAMAGGDLTDTLIPKGKDETAMLMGALAEMQLTLRSTVREVREAADVIKLSAEEVATGSMDLSQRTEQTAANLEQTASAMEQISSTVTQTTEGSSQAAGVASQNVKLADQGGQVIEQVVSTMSEIQDSSRRIGEIIGVIDSIAFQTNILALNAAVEAARAGEQGRGFAVVASEVRALAQRSAEAAREIKQLIVASGERVELGNRIVSEAGTTMRAIVESTSKVGSLLQGISSGAREQALGIEQVGKAIHELDQMTQQNAALVEETAAASSGMRQQAEQLARAVDAFKLH